MSENRSLDSQLPQEARASVELSVVVPAYDEASGLKAFHDRLMPVIDALGLVTEIIYVNDGSTDEDSFDDGSYPCNRQARGNR